MRVLLLTMLISIHYCSYGFSDLADYPDPPLEVLEEGRFIGPDTLEFWHSKLALPTSFFPEMPERLAKWLDDKQCRIAQPHVYEYFGTWKDAYPANCVQGNFDGEGLNDWAMILECQDELYLGIFWDGDPERGRILSLKYLSDGFNGHEYFKEKGIYNGYYILLNRVKQEELNNSVSSSFEYFVYDDYEFKHDGIKLNDYYCYSDRDSTCYPVLYWDGIRWQAFGPDGNCISYQTPTNLDMTVMRDAASLPRIDLLADFNQDTLSLPPEYFPKLPPELHIWLENNQYRIPQVTPRMSEIPFVGPHNVINGNFDGTGEEDWAAIVFRADTVKAFVFFDTDTTQIEQFNVIEESAAVKGIKTFKIGYWYSNFHLFLKRIDKATLIENWQMPSDPDSGDTLDFLLPWTHDALIIYRLEDMAPPGPVRYYHEKKWYFF